MMPGIISVILAEHFAVDDDDSVLGQGETLRVIFGVYANDRAFGYPALIIEDNVSQIRTATDFAARQGKNPIQFATLVDLYVGKQGRIEKFRYFDFATAANHGIFNPAGVSTAQKVGRRKLRLVGHDAPFCIVDIEWRCWGDEFHIRLIIGIDSADVPPIGLFTTGWVLELV